MFTLADRELSRLDKGIGVIPSPPDLRAPNLSRALTQSSAWLCALFPVRGRRFG